jgi:hypothetical protein
MKHDHSCFVYSPVPVELSENAKTLHKVRELIGKNGVCLDMAIAYGAGIEKFIEVRELVSKAGYFGETSIARWYNRHSLDEVLAVIDRAIALESVTV